MPTLPNEFLIVILPYATLFCKRVCLHLLQERELMTCFRDKFNIGEYMTLYVGSDTRNAYLNEFNKIKNDTYLVQED